jgi:hypothetical protein
VLDRVRDCGVAGITVGAVHHGSSDLTPHGRSKLTLRHDGAHFELPDDLFAGLRPLKAERSFVPLGPMDAYLMALCFCDFCMARAFDLGVDADLAREECTRIIGGVLEGDRPSEGVVTRAALTAYAGPEVVDYARARSETVTSLVSEVADAVASEGSKLVFVDPTGAVKGARKPSTSTPTAWPATPCSTASRTRSAESACQEADRVGGIGRRGHEWISWRSGGSPHRPPRRDV